MIELYVFPAQPARLQGDGGCELSGHRADPARARSDQGRSEVAEYAALNPNMRMPTLKDGDYVLWESNAIMQYLASRWPESGLLPPDEKGRLDVTRWQLWDLAHWDPTCAVLVQVTTRGAARRGAVDARARVGASSSRARSRRAEICTQRRRRRGARHEERQRTCEVSRVCV